MTNMTADHWQMVNIQTICCILLGLLYFYIIKSNIGWLLLLVIFLAEEFRVEVEFSAIEIQYNCRLAVGCVQ